MLVLTLALVKITPSQDVAHLEAHIVVSLAGEVLEILLPEVTVYVERAVFGDLLEEGVSDPLGHMGHSFSALCQVVL
jgi:hypothetical protein